MSEIGGTNFNVGQTNFKGVQKSQLEPAVNNDTDGEATPQVTDFSNNKAEALGRSMLLKGADNINNDLKFKKEKIIKSVSKMKKDYRHLFYIDNKYMTENTYLKKMFDIKGNLWYYFKVNSISTTLFKESELTPDSDGLYAAITIDEDVDEIYGQDNKGVYEGLEFSTKIPDSIPANKHYLKLLNFDGTSFTSISNNWGFAAHAIGGIDGKYDK